MKVGEMMRGKNNERSQTRTTGGYFTVEAAMVLPVVIGTIVFIIYLQLYLYNRCLMDQETAMLAVQTVKTYSGDMKQTQEALMNWEAQNLTEKYVGWRKEQPVVTKKYDRLIFERKGHVLTDHALWETDIQYENRIMNTTVFLRNCRKSQKAVERVRKDG